MPLSLYDRVIGPMMKNVATHVMTTVNAPYGADLSAHQLAAMIADPKSAVEFSALVFAFFSEVPAAVQKQFLDGMGDRCRTALDTEAQDISQNLLQRALNA